MAQLKDLLVLGSSRFIGDIFANNLQAFRITDHLIPIEDETYDLGSSSLKWNNIYAKNTYADGQTLQELILQRSTTADNAFNAVNPRITFKNGDGSQSAQLIFTDYDTVTNPSSQALSPVSLTLRANSGEAQLVVPRLRVGGYINNSYTFSAESAIINSWIRTVGTTGWYSETYGGGWYMSDNTWIRSYGNKSIYHNQGTLRTDGTFQVGDSGKYVNLSSSGFKFGDTAAASANNLLTVNGHLLIEPAYNTNNSYNEGLRINRSTTGYANVTLGGVKGSLTGTGNGVWWIGTLSTPANDTTAASSLTGSNFYISHASSTGASTRLQGHWSSTATNSQGFSIWPRLGINDNPNNDYTLYVNGNVLTEGYLQLGTSSQSAAPSNKGIRVHDLRSVSFTPDTFGDYNVQFYFDDAGGRGSSWSTIMHLKGWTGAYAAHQLSFNAHNNTTNVNLYHRSGIGNTWGNWIGIADSNNVSWAAWTAGTTAGPKANLVVAGVTKTSDAIPSASQTASGIVTTGTQNFQGRKRFGNITFRAYNDSGTANQWPGDVFLENNAGTRVGEYWYDTGNATNITKGQFYWRQYSPNSTADTATTGFYETYSLPNVASGLTENKSYSILTTKSLVSVAQGGTGKSSWTPWGIIYASAATTLAQVTAGADTEYNNKYQFLMSNGAAAPVWRTAFNIDSGPNLPVLANESDLNSLTTPGVYVVRDSTAMKTIVNNPLGANAGSGGRIITMGGYTTTANSYQWQFVFTAGGSPQFRNRANTTWNGWRTFVHSTTNTAIGSTTKPVYIKADGTATEVSYSISATLNAGVTPHMAYYSGNNTIDDTDNLRYLNINSTTTTTRTSAGAIRGIQISGTCYGNDVAYLNSTTAGDFSLGDPGPQIQFGSSDGAAKAAIIYTNHNSNGLGGSSFQFVSDENPINLVAGGFVARTRAIVGQRSLDTNYTFRVTGTTYLGGDVTLDGNSAILRTGKSISWNQAHQYAMIRMTTQSGWSPLWAMKANTGWWTMGHYNSGAFNDQLLFGFLADVDTSGTSGAKNHLDFTVRLLPQVYASGTDTTADRAFVISTYDGTNKALKGSATKPVYVDSQGVVTETTYSLGATVNGGTTPYVAYYSGNNAISSAKDVTTMIMPSHYYHAMYSNASTGTEVYVHYYNSGISSTNTNANLRVKNGSSYNVFRICGAGEATWDGTQIRATNGLLASTKNSNTVTIGSQNASYTHIYNSASIPFIFNNSVLTTTGNLGNSAYPWNNLYIGKTDTKGIYYVGTKSTNRMITFVDNTADEYGNGIKIGGGGLVVIGSGESSNIDVAAGTENTYILADGINFIESNANTLANRIGFAVNGSGNIIPIKAEANNNLLQEDARIA